MTVRRRPSGFTLIEIVLVLAIAGLLLVVVFLAVSGAQRSRRDHQRRQDLARVVAAVESYASTHNGIRPQNQAQATEVITTYVNSAADPLLGSTYNLTYRGVGGAHTDVPPVGTIYYQAAHWCNRGPNADPSDPTAPIAGNDTALSKFAVWTGMEAGGQAGGTWYCLDNL